MASVTSFPLVILTALLISNLCLTTVGKVFKPCELGIILMDQGIEFDRIGDWICLARAVSLYNSSRIGGQFTNANKNMEYGIFQISNYYHCYDEYKKKLNNCGLNCTDLIDDNLEDDIRCARLLYTQNRRTFRSWGPAFGKHCNSTDGNSKYYKGCDFANGMKPKIEGEHETNSTVVITSLSPGRIIVSCRVYGTLPIEVSWTKNRNAYSSSDPDFKVHTTVDDLTNSTMSTVFLRHVNVTLTEYVTLFTCIAQNQYGSDHADFLVKIIEPPDKTDPPDSIARKAVELGITFFVTSVIILTVAVVAYKRAVKEKGGLTAAEIENFKNGDHSEDKNLNSSEYINEALTFTPYNPEFEISRSELEIEKRDLLGSGQFGLVYKGKFNGKNVAVKTLKPNADKMYLKALLSELKVLIYVKGHGNVTEIIGAYTQELDKGVLLVVLELCPLGSLLKYLQAYRLNSHFSSTSDGKRTLPESNNEDTVDATVIDQRLMVAWSYQIASGMDYLTTKRVVHGDLAARNILLQTPQLIKITDFGLSKKLYTYSTYAYGEGPIPWEWEAPETLSYLRFSAASDAWSFGVTLWEIFSFAQKPYSGLSWTPDFPNQLENGLRLTKPNDASDSIFNIMENCWKFNPTDRPTFKFLRELLYLEVAKFSTVRYVDFTPESVPVSEDYRNVGFI